jgi:hypothetical protein
VFLRKYYIFEFLIILGHNIPILQGGKSCMRFNKLLFFSIMLTGVFLWACSDSHAGQLEEGKAAFDRQEYQKAYALLLPPAEGGDTYAQISIGYMLPGSWGVKE